MVKNIPDYLRRFVDSNSALHVFVQVLQLCECVINRIDSLSTQRIFAQIGGNSRVKIGGFPVCVFERKTELTVSPPHSFQAI